MTVLLVEDVLHFLLHRLNTKPDAVDSRRHAVHLAVQAPKVVKNLVVLLDGLELHGLCRKSLVPYRKCGPHEWRDLQADLHQVDEPAQLFDDLAALLGKLVRPDDLPILNAAASVWTRKGHTSNTCPNRPFSSYWSTQSESTAVSFVMSSINVCWLSSVPANPDRLEVVAC